MAPLVTSTLAWRIRDTGLAWPTVTTSTPGRLRDDSSRFSSMPSVMISTSSSPMPLSLAASSLVLGASSLNCSTTASRSSRASWEKIEHTPARYILRFSFWLKFSSGRFGKVLPPPRHSGEDARPARARPVPFCFHGFLFDLLTSPRAFCLRVPCLALARKAVMTWCTSDSLYSRAKAASEADTLVVGLPCSLITCSSMAPPLFLRRRLGFGGGPGGGGPARAGAGLGLGRLRDRRARRAHGGLHRHAAAARAGQRAADEQEPALGIDTDDLDVLDGAPHRAQVTRHALAGKHADRKSTRLNSSHGYISYAVFCLKKKNRTRGRS